MMIATHLGTQAHEVTDEDFSRLRDTVLRLVELRERQQAELIEATTAQLAPIVEAAAIQTAQAERQSAVIH